MTASSASPVTARARRGARKGASVAALLATFGADPMAVRWMVAPRPGTTTGAGEVS
jgi:hypothetical protein